MRDERGLGSRSSLAMVDGEVLALRERDKLQCFHQRVRVVRKLGIRTSLAMVGGQMLALRKRG